MATEEEKIKLLDAESKEKYNLYKKIVEKAKLNKKGDFQLEDGANIVISGQDFIYQNRNAEVCRIKFVKDSKILFFINENAKKREEKDNKEIKENCDSDQSENSDDSSNSVVSIYGMDVNKILQTSFDAIEEPISIIVDNIIDEQQIKFKNLIETISSLDYNFKYLKSDNYLNNKVEFIDIQNIWCDNLKHEIENSNKSFFYIFGPKGIGKTTLLLKCLNMESIPRLYFSLKFML